MKLEKWIDEIVFFVQFDVNMYIFYRLYVLSMWKYIYIFYYRNSTTNIQKR